MSFIRIHLFSILRLLHPRRIKHIVSHRDSIRTILLAVANLRIGINSLQCILATGLMAQRLQPRLASLLRLLLTRVHISAVSSVVILFFTSYYECWRSNLLLTLHFVLLVKKMAASRLLQLILLTTHIQISRMAFKLA